MRSTPHLLTTKSNTTISADFNKPSLFLSIDLEDFRHIRCKQLGLPARSGAYYVERGVELILGFLDNLAQQKFDRELTRVTFFTTAQIARDQSALVKKIVSAGHEIACHMFEHENVRHLSPGQFRALLKKATMVLEDASGRAVYGFRAPSFSLPDEFAQQWFFNILSELSYRYDSSCVHSPASIVQAKLRYDVVPHQVVPTASADIIEFPILRLPVPPLESLPIVTLRAIGGTFFRLLSQVQIAKILSQVAQHSLVPIVWLHPADLCEDFIPVSFNDLRRNSLLSALRYPYDQFLLNSGAQTVLPKLRALLNYWYPLGTMASVVQKIDALQVERSAPSVARVERVA